MIDFNEWEKFEFKVGQIKEVKDHPNADKLVVLKVDIGDKIIQLVAGIKQHYKKEQLLNKKIIVFTNLKPVSLRGVHSDGMLLAATKDNKVVLLTIDKDIDNGAKIS